MSIVTYYESHYIRVLDMCERQRFNKEKNPKATTISYDNKNFISSQGQIDITFLCVR